MIVRVNLSEKKIVYEEVPSRYAHLGGRALTSRIVADEVPPGCHPLGPNNKLVVAPGLLTGTKAPSAGRLSFGSKSPLTGTIKESNAGGISGQKIAALGIKAIIIEGSPPEGEWHCLQITEKGSYLEPAAKLMGKGTYEINDLIWSEGKNNPGIISIGPAGEMKCLAAGISTNDRNGQPGRFAGRGGLGAVLGSKGIKAIIVHGGNRLRDAKVVRSEAFDRASKVLNNIIIKNPITGKELARYGTASLVNVINEAGLFPTRNFRFGQFSGAEKISGEALAETIKRRGGRMNHACHTGCLIRCSNIYKNEMGEIICSPVEYETIWALGANIEIEDLDVIAKLNRMCNDLGLDTMETGAAMAVIMEGGFGRFGDATTALNLMEEVSKKTVIGRVLGSGAAVAGKVFGVMRVPTVKGQSLAGYDPRVAKNMGITYAASTMGADHTTAMGVLKNISGEVDFFSGEGQMDLIREMQIIYSILDGAGLCSFMAMPIMEKDEGIIAIAELFEAKVGLPINVNDLRHLAVDNLMTEREFNKKAGFTQSHDRLPEFLTMEPLPPLNTVFDLPNEDIDNLYEF